MKKRIIQFLTTYFLFVLLFVLQKPLFMVYYHDLYADVSFGDYFSVMWHGLPLDLSLAGYVTAIPGLILIASAWTDSSILRRIRQVYFGLIAFVCRCAGSGRAKCGDAFGCGERRSGSFFTE